MNEDSSPREDPLLTSARREMLITLGLWALATTVTMGVSLTWGYGRDPQTLTFVLGFPDWIFWGVIVPWAGSTLAATVFSLLVMQDAPLEPESGTDNPT